MKVICIKTDTIHTSGPNIVPNGSLIEGNVYTVIDTDVYDGRTYYRLAEIKYFAFYGAHLFIPISSIDETEFNRNYKTEQI